MSESVKLDALEVAELVNESLLNNSTAQAKLIELTQNKLFKFCVLLGNNREQAEDLCQESYVKAFISLTKLSDPKSFYPWLCQIAKNQFYDNRRKYKDSLAKQADQIEDEADFSDPAYESILMIRKILASFDEDSKFLLLMVELEGMSYSEAAEVLKTSEDAVRSKLHRLRQEFIKKMK